MIFKLRLILKFILAWALKKFQSGFSPYSLSSLCLAVTRNDEKQDLDVFNSYLYI